MTYITPGAASLALALALIAAALPQAARAGETAPLRKLVWHANVGGRISVTNSAAPEGPSENAGHMRVMGGSEESGARASVRVDIALDVIGTLNDGGLAALVSESGDRTKSKVRIDIHPDGGLGVEPGREGDVSLEEREIAVLCAPALLPNQPLEVGTTWSDDSKTGTIRRTATHRVTALNGPRVTIVTEEDVRGTALGAFDRRTVRTLVYDAKTLLPVNVTMDRITHGGASALTTTVDSFEYTLAADSFAR